MTTEQTEPMTEAEAYKWAAQATRAIRCKVSQHVRERCLDSVASAILEAYHRGEAQERGRCEAAFKAALAKVARDWKVAAERASGFDGFESRCNQLVAGMFADMAQSLDLTARLGVGTGEPVVERPDPFLDSVIGEWIRNNPLPHRRTLRGLAQHVADAVRNSTTSK